jgi:dipeptidyl aminopeptidase/acylaminoacyl peptidase
MRRFLKWFGAVLLLLFVALWIGVGYVGTNIVTAASHRKAREKSEIAGKPVEQVSITTEDGVVLSAWYVPNGGENAVITLPGITADRGQLVPTAETYINWGFSALLPDLRGTGESQGDLVSIGYHERKDLIACVRWLQNKGIKTIGAHGFSLGAATVCFAMKELPDLGFAVVESSYDTMKSATEHRLDMVHMPHFIGWPFGYFLGRRIGADFADISPVNYISYCKCPALVMSGDSEGVVSPSETLALYEKCGSDRKQMHSFKNGRHRPSISEFPDEARSTLRQFLTEEVGCILP